MLNANEVLKSHSQILRAAESELLLVTQAITGAVMEDIYSLPKGTAVTRAKVQTIIQEVLRDLTWEELDEDQSTS